MQNAAHIRDYLTYKIREKRELQSRMVGQLYPSIIEDQISILREKLCNADY